MSGSWFWNPDNTYYLNKALHLRGQPDLVPDPRLPLRRRRRHALPLRRHPVGIDNSYLAVTSNLTGIAPATLLFRVVVPLSMFLLPFAARYAARGIGLQRAGLVGGFAAAATLIMTASESHSLFAQASLGKTIGRLVFVPILIGASAHLMRRNGPGAALRATLAAICAVGCSPSLVFAAALVLVPFTAAGLWDLWPTRAQPLRSQLRATVCLLAPLGFIGCFAGGL